jgi:hypothetical protein
MSFKIEIRLMADVQKLIIVPTFRAELTEMEIRLSYQLRMRMT